MFFLQLQTKADNGQRTATQAQHDIRTVDTYIDVVYDCFSRQRTRAESAVQKAGEALDDVKAAQQVRLFSFYCILDLSADCGIL